MILLNALNQCSMIYIKLGHMQLLKIVNLPMLKVIHSMKS